MPEEEKGTENSWCGSLCGGLRGSLCGPVEAEVDKLAEAWLGVVALLMGRAKVLS